MVQNGTGSNISTKIIKEKTILQRIRAEGVISMNIYLPGQMVDEMNKILKKTKRKDNIASMRKGRL